MTQRSNMILYRACVMGLLFMILGEVQDTSYAWVSTLCGLAVIMVSACTVFLEAVHWMKGHAGTIGYEVDDWLDPGSTRRGK